MSSYTYDLAAVRSKILVLLGWTQIDKSALTSDDWQWYIKDHCGEVWRSPSGDLRHEMHVSSCDDGLALPDPVCDLNVLLPLIDKYRVVLRPPSMNVASRGKWVAGTQSEYWFEISDESAALAVCLSVLLRSGVDLSSLRVNSVPNG